MQLSGGLSVGTPQEQTVDCTLNQHVCPHTMHTVIMAYQMLWSSAYGLSEFCQAVLMQFRSHAKACVCGIIAKDDTSSDSPHNALHSLVSIVVSYIVDVV